MTGHDLLLERDAELGEIDAALELAREGKGQLAVIEGPAGIGKSRLVAAARERASDAGLRVLSARGGELERAYGLGIVRQPAGAYRGQIRVWRRERHGRESGRARACARVAA